MKFKILFITGLLFETIGQVLLAQGNDFVYAQKPIDFAHWFSLIGVMLLLPQIAYFPKKIYSYFGIPVTIIGIVSIIGMCVLDFIWWSFPTQELRNKFTSHISKIPSIWKPFITTGWGFFTIGLLILSLNYFKKNKLSVIIIILATSIVFFGRIIPHRLILTYLMTTIGFALIFYSKTILNEHET